MNRSDIKKDYNDKFSQLRKLINSWELIPGAPKDEFDGLNWQILSHLYKEADIEKINQILSSELTATFGLYSDEFEARELASEVVQWWNSTDKLF